MTSSSVASYHPDQSGVQTTIKNPGVGKRVSNNLYPENPSQRDLKGLLGSIHTENIEI